MASVLSPERAVPSVATPRKPGWGWPQYLALAGLPILFLEIWTLIAWATDNPHQVNKYRDVGSPNWWACTILQVVMVAIALVVAVIVIRGCIRERRLTFDGAFCLAGMLMWWADTNASLINPYLLFSSNMVNVNSPLGHMPFMINKSVGDQADPILFTIPIESFTLLGVVMVVCAIARKLRARFPAWSTGRFIWTLAGAAIVVEILIEGLIVRMGVWTYTSPAHGSLPLGDNLRLPIGEVIAGAAFWLLPALLRMYKNDRGETLIERRLPTRPRVRGAVLFLAMYGFTEILAWGPAAAPDYLQSFYQKQWPELPNYLVNDICNAPGVTDSPYGLCPGSVGYRMPGPFTPGHR